VNLFFQDGSSFSTGSCRYVDQVPPGDLGPPRIYIPIAIQGKRTLAALDTGGVYVICDPELASILDLSDAESTDVTSVRTWARRYDGKLYRLPVTLVADEGDTLQMDATIFVPELDDGEPWPFPTAIVGYSGCLERLRFAVSPLQEPDARFYFGPV
jgi:hypothetical protein